MTHRIKPLVWVRNGKFSFLGHGFGGYIASIYHREDGRFKIDFHGIDVLLPTLAMAKEMLEDEYREWIATALEPTDHITIAKALPEIKALVGVLSACRPRIADMAQSWQAEATLLQQIDAALAALKGPQT